jgi:hypothetical protein
MASMKFSEASLAAFLNGNTRRFCLPSSPTGFDCEDCYEP